MKLATAFVALAGCTAALPAQQVRVHSTTTGQFVQLRALRPDSTGTWTAGDVNTAAPLSEDLEVSAWGFGIPGLHGYGLFRLRGAIGSKLVWPRYNDHFDALAAWLELERSSWRLRIGRQLRSSGLGLYGFDGGTLAWRPWPNARVEAFGGRALARGTSDPINTAAVRSLDPLIPSRGTLLAGVSAWIAPTALSTASATWQKEVLNDFSGIVSERVAVDAQTVLAGRLVLSGSADYDMGLGALGKARLGATALLPRSASMALSVFRYRPTFDLTTIWGVFAPQSHRGASATATLPPVRGVTLAVGWIMRAYQDVAVTTPFLVDVGTTTHDLSLGATWTRDNLSVSGDYRFLRGYAGEESAGDLRVALDRDRWRLGFTGTAFQNTEYFRVARGTVVGLGADARFDLSERLSVSGSLFRFLHTGTSGMDSPDWSQTRALLQVDLVFGATADRSSGNP